MAKPKESFVKMACVRRFIKEELKMRCSADLQVSLDRVTQEMLETAAKNAEREGIETIKQRHLPELE